MKSSFPQRLQRQILSDLQDPAAPVGRWNVLIAEPGQGVLAQFTEAARAVPPGLRVETVDSNGMLEACGRPFDGRQEGLPIESSRNLMREHLQRLAAGSTVLLIDATAISASEAIALEEALLGHSDVGLERFSIFVALTPRQIESGIVTGLAASVAPRFSPTKSTASPPSQRLPDSIDSKPVPAKAKVPASSKR